LEYSETLLLNLLLRLENTSAGIELVLGLGVVEGMTGVKFGGYKANL
jgi:hypothetical protein